MSAFIRLGRRKTIPEVRDPVELCKLVFSAGSGGLDLRPSIYQTDGSQAQLVQAHAEHAASFLTRPVRGALHFDLTHLFTHAPRAVPGTTAFAFTRTHHHELEFASDDELTSLSARLLFEIAGRKRTTSFDELRTYMRGRMQVQDPEWITCKATKPPDSEWHQVLRA